MEGIWVKGENAFLKTLFIMWKYSKTSELCWRECGAMSDFTHIFWDCQKEYKISRRKFKKRINRFWPLIFSLKPELYKLAVIPDTIKVDLLKCLLRMLLLIAKTKQHLLGYSHSL